MSSDRKQTQLNDPTDDTRQRLIEAGLSIFSRYSYEGATTRLIAENAGVNLAAIPYHFGGKEGLYRATLQSIVDQFRAQMLPTIQTLRQTVENAPLNRQTSLDDLCRFLSQFISNLITLNIPRSWLRLGFSDDNAPVHAFDLIYQGIIYPIHDTVGILVANILDLPTQGSETILRTHAIIGQVIAFHLSREAVLRRLNQTELTGQDIQLIQAIIEENVRAILSGSTHQTGVTA